MQLVGYLCDSEQQAAANARGANYWFAYVQEVVQQLGVAAKRVDCAKASKLLDTLRDLRLLIVGDSRSVNTAAVAKDIAEWVEDGGTLVGFAPEGLDALFGNTLHSVTPQIASGFLPTALMRFQPHPLTTGVYSRFFEKQPLPLFGPVRKSAPDSSEALAWLFSLREAKTDFPAVTHRQVGNGHAYYFAFDLAQTMWVLHKGRPIDGDYDLDGYLRLSDAMVTGAMPQDVPYGDELLFLLQNILHQAGVPMVHQIPPCRGEVGDLLVFFGGDDEGLKDGSQMASSEFMKSRGLPYHINIMPDPQGNFGLSVEDHDRIVANGHETSLHYNFIDAFQHPCGFAKEDVEQQWNWFCQTFGRKPIATVNHWCRWCGWTEPAKWMQSVGGRADNSRFGVSSPPLNPTNTIGFFGTAFPHYYYEDWQGENRKIDFLCEPIVAYEVGYDADSADFETSHRALDLAAYYHMTIDFFHHPVYIAQRESCRQAIDELMRYLGQLGLRPVYSGCDGLWEWWDGRSRSHVDVLNITPTESRFVARCQHREGMVVKVPAARSAEEAMVAGRPAPFAVQEHCGLRYAMVVCPAGESEVSVTFA